MDDYRKREVDGFLSQVVQLTVEDFAVVQEHAVSVDLSSFPNRGRARVSASDYSWLKKRVGDVLRPLLVTLEWPDDGLAVGAVVYSRIASAAIIGRAKMSAAQYDTCVGGFRQVGVVVPPHPSEVESAAAPVDTK